MRKQVETLHTKPLKDLMQQKYLYIKHFQVACDPQELLEQEQGSFMQRQGFLNLTPIAMFFSHVFHDC